MTTCRARACRWISPKLGCLSALIWATSAAWAGAAETPVYEAEWAWRLDAPAILIRDPACSGGLAVSIPDGTTEDDVLHRGPALLNLWLSQRPAGFTRLWARVRWENVCGNSFVCAVIPDGVGQTVVTGSIMKKWCWVMAADLKPSPLPATLRLWNREDGICVDQFALLPPGKRPPPDGAPLPASPPCAADDPSVPSFAILLTTPVNNSRAEWLDVHPSHPSQPKTNRWARDEILVTPHETTRADLWICNTRLIETSITLRIEAPAGLCVQVRETAAISLSTNAATGDQLLIWQKSLPAGQPLFYSTLEFMAGEFPMVTRPLRIQVMSDTHVLAERTLYVTHPMDWMLIGPFRAKDTDDIARMQERLTETLLAKPLPTAPATTGSRLFEPSWIRFQPRHLGSAGRVDLNAVFGQQINCCAFAYTYVIAATNDSSPFLIEHDDGIQVWVNGKTAYRNAESRPAVTSRQRVNLPLVTGLNRIVIRIDQNREHWQFRLSPDSDDGTYGNAF
ncbi:MAG: hypothetical protein WCR06_00165 [bacterium]